jgi:hypothetical protein
MDSGSFAFYFSNFDEINSWIFEGYGFFFEIRKIRLISKNDANTPLDVIRPFDPLSLVR